MNPVFLFIDAAKGIRLPGCRPPNHQNRNLKRAGFLEIMISNLFRDFRFCRNQSLKSTDELEF
jgi:hypothetical protein